MNLKSYKPALYSFVAPAVLVIIACCQFYMVHVHGLTPWKFGGFGMFSTVDSHGARFLRIYLITSDGRYPVEIPNSMKTLARKVRTVPTPTNLSRLANELAQATWVPFDYNPLEPITDDFQNQSPTVADGNGTVEEGNLSRFDEQPQNGQAERMATEHDRPRYRVKHEGEPGPGAENKVIVHSVQVELWRFGFNAADRQINAYKFRETTAHTQILTTSENADNQGG